MNILKRATVFTAAVIIVCILLVNAFAAGDTGFADIDAGADFAEAVIYCRDNGLMNGVSADRFDPDGTLTRAMAATILYRAEGEPSVSGTPSFNDTKAGTWYSNAIVWADIKGIVRGYGNGMFGTNDPVSVEQLEVILGRYSGNGQEWKGNPAKAVAATRAQAAVSFFATLTAMKQTGTEASVEPENTSGGRVLVAYFSATNNTEGVAEKIAAALGEDRADLFEIVPETPYTSADLNYNSDCRANREQNDADARPAIASSCKVTNMSDYDTVFIGYPIWWGKLPKIMYTFLEQYDLSGKNIIPFCTSGSSGIGTSVSEIRTLQPGASVDDGRRFAAGTGADTIKAWLDGLKAVK